MHELLFVFFMLLQWPERHGLGVQYSFFDNQDKFVANVCSHSVQWIEFTGTMHSNSVCKSCVGCVRGHVRLCD